jgi:hypothetical protein
MPTIEVLMDVEEHYVSTPAFTYRFDPRYLFSRRDTVLSLDATTGQADLWLEPISGVLMLRPVYDGTRDTNNDNATTSGGTWAEVDNLWGTACTWMHQTDATATDTYIESTSAFEANTNLYVDLFLHEDDATDYTVTITWGGLWKLDIYRDGQATLWARETTESEYEKYASGRVARKGESLFEKRMTLAIIGTRAKTVAVVSDAISNDPEDTELYTRAAPSTAGASAADPYTIFEEAKCRVTVSDGAYIAGIRPFVYPATGSMLSPIVYMAEHSYGSNTYTGDPTLTQKAFIPTDASVTHSIRDADGNEFGEGADKSSFRDKVELAASGTGNTRTPQVCWTQVRVPPATTASGLTSEDVSDKVQRVLETLGIDGSHTVSLDFKPGEDYWKAGYPNMYCSLSVDETPRTTFYASDPEYVEFEGTYQVKWNNCENRLLKLKHFMLSDAYVFDGMLHTDAVQLLLNIAGVPDADMTITADPLGRVLPEPEEGEEALFRFSNGTTAFDAIKYICDVFSGWTIHIDGSGKFVYEDLRGSKEASAVLYKAISAEQPDIDVQSMGHNTKLDSSQYYNQIWVVGEDEEGNVLFSYWEDPAGWVLTERLTQVYEYVGERRKLVYIDPALTTQAAVEATRDVLIDVHGYPSLMLSVKSWYNPALRPGQWVLACPFNLFTPEYFRIESIQTEITMDSGFATYELKWMGWGG